MIHPSANRSSIPRSVACLLVCTWLRALMTTRQSSLHSMSHLCHVNVGNSVHVLLPVRPASPESQPVWGCSGRGFGSFSSDAHQASTRRGGLFMAKRTRRLAFAPILALLFLAMPAPGTTLDIGDTEVTLTCDDGYSLTVTVDADTLVALTVAVQAINADPISSTCLLARTSLART